MPTTLKATVQDYYKLLNISKTASNEDIKKAYRQGALFWHPDKNKSQNAHNKFIQINEAYNILIDEQKRIMYDKLYDIHYTKQIDLAIYQETKADYKVYSDWVKEARVKAEKLATVSIDNALTDTFYFIDKYGWLILVIILGGFLLFALSIKK